MTATDRTTLVQRLQEHTTIGSAPLPELEWLAAHGYLRRYAAGDFVIRTGQERGSFGLFVLLTGHLALVREPGTGGTPQTRRVRGGEVSGILEDRLVAWMRSSGRWSRATPRIQMEE